VRVLIAVTNFKGESEPLEDYKDLEINEEINGDFSLSFTTFDTKNNKFAFPLIKEESLVEELEEGHEFRIKKLGNTRKHKRPKTQHIFFDLKRKQIYDYIGGTKNAQDIFSFLLKGTDWTFEVVNSIPHQLFANFGKGNVVKLIWDACDILGCEIKIFPNKHLKVYKEMGSDNDFIYRYKDNIKNLKEDINTNDLRTVIKGYGANGLEVTYRSPNADIFGELEADPIEDDRYTVAESLIERCKQELNDVPEVSIEIEEIDLGEGKELGDKVWLIYEPLGIAFQTRIMARKRFPNQKGKNTVTLGNRKKTFSDILTETRVEIDQNNKQHRSRFEQTNNRITMEVERLDGDVTEAKSQFQIEADNISSRVEEVRTETLNYADTQATSAKNDATDYTDGLLVTVNQRITDAESSIVQNADSITSKVEATTYETGIADTKTYAELKASEAQSAAETYTQTQASLAQTEAEAYADGIVTAEETARIADAQAKLAEAKSHAESEAAAAEQAAKEYADGEIGPIVTRITDAESSITELDDEIRSRVSETVYLADQATMNGKIDDVNSDVSGLGTRVYNAESEISQQATQISQRVSYTDYNGDTIISKVNQDAYSYKIEASSIDLDGITRVNGNLKLGSYGSNKSLEFNDSTWLQSSGDGFEISSGGYIILNSYGNYSRKFGVDYPIVESTQSHQDISLEVTSTGGLRVSVNGKVATFTPTSWT
jgi:Prophage endopeptidase tail/Prophage endopeptidase tail N-terminal domain